MEQNEIHWEIINAMHKILENLKSINEKAADWIDKMVINKKASTFPKTPTVINETIFGQWYDEILAQMMAAP